MTNRIINFTFPLYLVFIIWIGLFIWRKTFSYISFFGVYIIEFSIIISIFFVVLIYLINYTNIRRKISTGSFELRSLYFTTTILLILTFLRSIFDLNINFKGLIPTLYPIYFIFFLILFSNQKFSHLINIYKISFLFFLLPIISFFVVNIFSIFFEYPELPGQTFVYGVALALPFLFKNRITTFILFFISSLFAILLMERASFLNFGIAMVLLFLYNSQEFSFKKFIQFFFLFVVISVVFIFISPLIFEFIFGDIFSRFDLTPSNLINFLKSIISSNADISGDALGTRSHRLNMWYDIISIVSSNINTLLFGYGFSGEVLDILGVDFRAPHNGFVTIFYRMGLIGLFSYIFFLLSIWKCLISIKTNKYNMKIKGFALIIFGCFIGDGLTGTIIDSPFTYLIFLFQIALVITLLKNHKIELVNNT